MHMNSPLYAQISNFDKSNLRLLKCSDWIARGKDKLLTVGRYGLLKSTTYILEVLPLRAANQMSCLNVEFELPYCKRGKEIILS